MKKEFDITLYLVTDRKLSLGRSNSEVVERALKSGVTMVQYREKELPFREMLIEASRLKYITHKYNKTFIVNDRVDLALAVDADGVHLGQDDMPVAIARRLLPPDKIIGCSVRNLNEALLAMAEGADYIALSGVLPTPTKPDTGGAIPTNVIIEITKNIPIPIVAIGGIKPENAHKFIELGADGVAVVSAIVSAKNIEAATEKLFNAVKNALSKYHKK